MPSVKTSADMEEAGRDRGLSVSSESLPESRPIEPGGSGFKLGWVKGFLFLIFMIYLLVSTFHVTILTAIGRFLIVEQSPEKSDLIVCATGGIVSGGLAAADAYNKKFAPKLFISREKPPEGYDILRARGIQYPRSAELLAGLLQDLGVPTGAFIYSDTEVGSVPDEARAVKRAIAHYGFKSMVIITSPIQSRRTWLTYKDIFGDDQTRIIVLVSQYSEFRPEDWWKRRLYIREVIFEYQKLIIYFFQTLL